MKEFENTKPLISIITIVKNSESTIERCIESVINQSYDNIEYIIINGNSLDNTNNVLEKLEAYPNPVASQLTIEASDMINQIEIFNILGQSVLILEGTSNKMNIDVSSLTAGTYMARVTSGNSSKTIKLIKV